MALNRFWVMLLVAGFLASCAAPRTGSLDAFPAMPSDQPPGASAQAWHTAKALGRGINFGNMLEAPREGDWGLKVQPALINAAAEAGFQTVRLPVRWSNHALPRHPFTLDAAFATRVESQVDALLARGFYVILNMHHYRQLDGDVADTGEATQDAGLAEERFLTLWQQIAQRFAGKSERLVIELYNEPHGRLDAARWNDLLARALAVVRQHHPTRAVLIGGIAWNNARALADLRLPNDPHLIATIHHYEPFTFTHQGAFWIKPELLAGVSCCDDAQRATMLAQLDLAKAWSVQQRYPVFVGEFGAYKAADMVSRAAYTRTLRDAMEVRGFSWAYWEMAAHFGVYDPDARVFRAPLLQALMGGP